MFLRLIKLIQVTRFYSALRSELIKAIQLRALALAVVIGSLSESKMDAFVNNRIGLTTVLVPGFTQHITPTDSALGPENDE
jgi:hypothetical protein